MFRLFCTLLISVLFGCSLIPVLLTSDLLTGYSAAYFSGFFGIWFTVLNFFSSSAETESHYRDDSEATQPHPSNQTEFSLDSSGRHQLPNCFVHFGPALRLRGGYSDDDDSSSNSSSIGSESESDSGVGPSKRKRHVPKTDKPRKQRNKGKGKAKAKPSPHDSDSDSNSDVEGIQVTLGRENAVGTGMYVDEVIRTSQAAECWDVPRKSHRVAYVVDFNATPECLTTTVDAFIKKQLKKVRGTHSSLQAGVNLRTRSRIAKCRLKRKHSSMAKMGNVVGKIHESCRAACARQLEPESMGGFEWHSTEAKGGFGGKEFREKL
ncbi:hypothetical protein B0H13DRAFT_1880593 [Mycena leptocephala]|nr:hypothetical protein B0H13DRAFT_1880593 [Mycena leptocephala]